MDQPRPGTRLRFPGFRGIVDRAARTLRQGVQELQAAAKRSKVGSAKRIGRSALMAAGWPVAAALFDADAAKAEARKADQREGRLQKTLSWARAGAIVTTAVSAAVLPWVASAAIPLAAGALAATATGAAIHLAEARSDLRAGRSEAAPVAVASAVGRGAGAAAATAAKASGGFWALALAAAAILATDTVVEALSRKRRAAARLRRIKDRRTPADALPSDDAEYSDPAPPSEPAARRSLRP